MAGFQSINRFVVLMLENRSFDHLFGYLKATNPSVVGLTGNESNQKDPNSPASPQIKVSRASSFVMRFDPGHEFYDVQIQLYGPLQGTDPTLPPVANPPFQTAPMNGFIASATQAVDYSGDENMVMECFQSDQLPVLTALANEFAMFNFWYSSLPGPTWPNRFFIHAATSGGLSDSPTNPRYWAETMLIVTFDEHGGFYDDQPPPATVPTGDDSTHANPDYNFDFARWGIRVPAIVVSAYTVKGTVIGADANDATTRFDHTSALATVEKRFGLKPLTQRDAAANTLEIAINNAIPRLSAADALAKLPNPAPDSVVTATPDATGNFCG